MSEARWEVPESWAWVASGEISRIVGGGTPAASDQANFSDNAVAWITPADLSGYREAYISKGKRDLSEKGYQSSSAMKVPAGTVLYSSRAPIGYSVIAANEISTSQGFKNFILRGGISPEYIRYYLLSSVDYAESLARGTTFKELSAARAAQLSIPLSPLPEQRRIVAKLDSLLSRTAFARGAIDSIPALIEKYKARILDMAFSGELTRDLRPASTAKKFGSNELPIGWEIKPLGDISEIQGGIQVGKKRKTVIGLESVPYLRVANVQRGWLNLHEIKTIEVTRVEKERLLLREGDILMNEGGDRDKLGRGWIWEGQISDCIHQNHVFRIRLKDASFPPKFVSHYANEKGQRYFFDQGTQTTNLASVSKRKIAALPVPVPPKDEAVEIARRIETAFAWLNRVSEEHAAGSRRLPLLDASILQAAFRGELIPQNPHDEPASRLLEKIEAEKETKPAKMKAERKAASRSKKPTKRGATMAELIEVLKSKADWVSASNVAHALGIGDGATSDAVEEFYNELRAHLQNGHIEVERRGDEDWLRLMPVSEG